jgi:integrase
VTLDTTNPNFRQLTQYYVDNHVRIFAVDKKAILYALDPLVIHFGPTRPPYTQQQINDYIALRQIGGIGKRAVKGPTIRKELAYFRRVLSFGASNKLILKDDVTDFNMPPAAEPRDVWLTRPEGRQLIEAAALLDVGDMGRRNKTGRAGKAYRFILAALYTAARKSAIENLTWFQVDFDQRIIKYNPTGRLQTKKRRPQVPIADAFMPFMERFYYERRSEFFLDDASNSRPQFDRAVKLSGLQKHVTPHVLRHTWAVWAAQDGVSLYDIAGVLGDDMDTVKENYLHHCPDHLRNAVNRSAI